MVRTHKDLDVWKKSLDLVDAIYDMSASLPADEKFGIISQMKRAVVSIPSNIAEGAGRNSRKELLQYLTISRGSLAEIETQLIICQRRNWVNEEQLNEVNSLVVDVSKMLFRFAEKLRHDITA
jgi:four helix bundle protein